jgi:hypothetical protein
MSLCLQPERISRVVGPFNTVFPDFNTQKSLCQDLALVVV